MHKFKYNERSRLNMLRNIDYSTIINRTNKNTPLLSKHLISRLYKILYTNKRSLHRSDNARKFWKILMQLGHAGHFSMKKFLWQNIHVHLSSKHPKHSKSNHKYFIKALPTQQWKQILLHILNLLNISSQDIKTQYHQNKKSHRMHHKRYNLYKHAIRLYNLWKVEQDFYNKNAVVILTSWQLDHIESCNYVIRAFKPLINNLNTDSVQSRLKINLGGIVLNLIFCLYNLSHNAMISKKKECYIINHYCHTHYHSSNFTGGHPYLTVTKQISPILTVHQWYSIFKSILQKNFHIADRTYISKTLHGHTLLYKQYCHQTRTIIYLSNKGIPIKYPYKQLYHYDTMHSFKSISNPARTFYKHSHKWKHMQYHIALKYMP